MKNPTVKTVEIDFGAAGLHECDVAFYYSPGEPSDKHSPGCPEEFDIDRVSIKGVNVEQLFGKALQPAFYVAVEKALREQMDADDV